MVKQVIVASTQNHRRPAVTSGVFQAPFATVLLFANLEMAMVALPKSSVSTVVIQSINHTILSVQSIPSRVSALIRRYPY